MPTLSSGSRVNRAADLISTPVKRRCRQCQTLEIQSITATPGTSLNFNVSVAATDLNDGDFYRLVISRNLAMPSNLTGAELVFITAIGGTTKNILVTDWRCKRLRSERLDPCDRLCMVYTADSAAGAANATPAEPVFSVRDGIAPVG